jgi:hypothetical protein
MDREDWGKILFYSLCLTEAVAPFGIGTLSAIEVFSVVALVGVVLPFVVGYLVADRGLFYGVVLGIFPAVFAILQLPNGVFGSTPVPGVVALLLASPLLSALSGLAGQRFALWRDNAA